MANRPEVGEMIDNENVQHLTWATWHYAANWDLVTRLFVVLPGRIELTTSPLPRGSVI